MADHDGRRPLPEAIKAHADRFVFLEHEVLDSMVSAMMELSAQVWTLKRRMLTTEALLARKGVTLADEVETFTPSAEEAAAWRAERDLYVQSVFAPFARVRAPAGGAPE